LRKCTIRPTREPEKNTACEQYRGWRYRFVTGEIEFFSFLM
jgi:hypothetical protein